MNANLNPEVLAAILAEVSRMADEPSESMRNIIAEHIYQMAEENIPF